MSHADENEGTRRDFLFYATGGAGAVAVGAAVWPLVNQMNPSADVLALSTIRVDVSEIQVGTQITVLWQGKPVFVRRRSAEEIAAAVETPLSELPDNVARNDNLADDGADAADANRSLAPFVNEDGNTPEGYVDGEWLVQMGVCTHLGCVPLGDAGDFGGWFCPCHGSHYDTSGRIRRGPAPENLPVPPARFDDEATIIIG